MATKKITDTSFDSDVLKAGGPVLVDFWAEWCGPCRMIGPALEELSEELGEKVTITKINIDENPETPGKYGVRGIPTMILFKDGLPAATKVGAAPKSALKGWLEQSLA
ncbi:thioredoxin TrxA [Sphingomonas sp. BIUV-7]|uniref:Thioredoxin n=1 Tax=Sphingomonas natans TaxID=3063330 RepID=A0ABT8YA01_9SPHN|nr:thioredoxin TrxA [Sphingomonas sp. BIUV-7]MDO6415156.1 thioredoxin TrxA [Sphingomonas sp. BIUV-7]